MQQQRQMFVQQLEILYVILSQNTLLPETVSWFVLTGTKEKGLLDALKPRWAMNALISTMSFLLLAIHSMRRTRTSTSLKKLRAQRNALASVRSMSIFITIFLDLSKGMRSSMQMVFTVMDFSLFSGMPHNLKFILETFRWVAPTLSLRKLTIWRG